MAKLLRATALVFTLALAAPVATAADNRSDAGKTDANHVEGIKPDQIRMSNVIGGAVYDVQNQKVGDVKDLIVDKDANVIENVGAFFGMGGKHVALDPTDCKTDNNRLTVSNTKDELKQMAAFELDDRNMGAGTSASPIHDGQLGSGSSAAQKP